MNRRRYLQKTTLSGVALTCGLSTKPSYGFRGPTGGTLAESLEILNLWETLSEAETRLFSAIYESLATGPNASFATVAGDKKVRALCEEQGVTHFGGPMLGCLASDGVKVWLRTTKPARVKVRLKIGGEEKTFGPVESSLESDLTAIVEVTGLEPGSITPYEILVDGDPIKIPKHAAITTPSADKTDTTRITFGTCQHRWGLGHGDQADTILKHKPLAMLMYGDVAVQDRRNDFGMHRADYILLSIS